MEYIRTINQSLFAIETSLFFYVKNPDRKTTEKEVFDKKEELNTKLKSINDKFSDEEREFMYVYSVVPTKYREILKNYLNKTNLKQKNENILNIIKKNEYNIHNMDELKGGSITNKYYSKYLKYKNKYLELSKLKKSKY